MGVIVSLSFVCFGDVLLHDAISKTTSATKMFFSKKFMFFMLSIFARQQPNGLRKSRMLSAGYWRWGGRGLCLGAGKTRSQKITRKCRRLGE
jgi:hypothetical protein